MCFFMGCPSDVSIMVWLAVILLVISFGFYLRARNILVSVLIFSMGMNVVLFLEAMDNSFWLREYHLQWLQYFSLFVWPIINIFLIIWYVRKKK